MRLSPRHYMPANFLRAEHGATAIEYALIATLICVAIIGALNLFADNMGNMFNSISNAVDSGT
ncbi:Flp family type IVb pilin [Magnetovibrio sp.]|uniref:Flp family type IVb pilin n=1 Tax=Magnetovibrio sp. TaxID=2024836 RepID=UPI002F95402C